MKTMVDKARESFKVQFAQFKEKTGMKNEEIARMLGCDTRTVSRIHTDPMSVSGKYILMIQEYLKKEERKYHEV